MGQSPLLNQNTFLLLNTSMLFAHKGYLILLKYFSFNHIFLLCNTLKKIPRNPTDIFIRRS